jgi:SAM-dependent methyltransferase
MASRSWMSAAGPGACCLDYLQQGIDMDGVDNSPEMLALCLQKAEALDLSPVLYEQYLENLSLPRRYRTILVPSSTLQLIIEPDQVRQAVKRLYEHLLPGGVLAASFMTIWKPDDPLYSAWEKTAVRAEDGATFKRLSRAWYDPAKRV